MQRAEYLCSVKEIITIGPLLSEIITSEDLVLLVVLLKLVAVSGNCASLTQSLLKLYIILDNVFWAAIYI